MNKLTRLAVALALALSVGGVAASTAAADLAMSECRASLNGENGEDNEIQRGVTLMSVNGLRPTGAWYWSFYIRRSAWEIRQDVSYERYTLRGTAWDTVSQNACLDRNHNGSIGGGGYFGPSGEDWFGVFSKWPYTRTAVSAFFEAPAADANAMRR